MKNKIIVIVEGGLVTAVLTDSDAEVEIIDYDTEGCDDGEVVKVPQHNMGNEDAYIYNSDLQVTNPERVNELFSLILKSRQ